MARRLNAKEQAASDHERTERLKLIGWIILLSIVAAIGFYADYHYKKAIVKDAIEEFRQVDAPVQATPANPKGEP